MKRAMISLPMASRTEEEIRDRMNEAREKLTALGYEVVESLFDFGFDRKAQERLISRGIYSVPLHCLAMALATMSICDTVYFCKGWENARGCVIEHEVAKAYSLDLIYETD